jgi:hypothetical protein
MPSFLAIAAGPNSARSCLICAASMLTASALPPKCRQDCPQIREFILSQMCWRVINSWLNIGPCAIGAIGELGRQVAVRCPTRRAGGQLTRQEKARSEKGTPLEVRGGLKDQQATQIIARLVADGELIAIEDADHSGRWSIKPAKNPSDGAVLRAATRTPELLGRNDPDNETPARSPRRSARRG